MADAGNKIYITISDKRGGGSGSGGVLAAETGGSGRNADFDSNLSPIAKADKDASLYFAHETVHFLKSEAMKCVNQYVGTIGIRTGNYVAQQNAQTSLGYAQQAVGIGMTAYTGFKAGAKIGSVGGPYGAAIGAMIGGTLAATSIYFQVENYKRQISIQNQDITALRQRAGLDTYSDSSRGTEN